MQDHGSAQNRVAPAIAHKETSRSGLMMRYGRLGGQSGWDVTLTKQQRRKFTE